MPAKRAFWRVELIWYPLDYPHAEGVWVVRSSTLPHFLQVLDEKSGQWAPYSNFHQSGQFIITIYQWTNGLSLRSSPYLAEVGKVSKDMDGLSFNAHKNGN